MKWKKRQIQEKTARKSKRKITFLRMKVCKCFLKVESFLRTKKVQMIVYYVKKSLIYYLVFSTAMQHINYACELLNTAFSW